MFELHRDAAGNWRWRLVKGGKTLATSGECFRKRSQVIAAIEKLKDAAAGAGVVEVIAS